LVFRCHARVYYCPPPSYPSGVPPSLHAGFLFFLIRVFRHHRFSCPTPPGKEIRCIPFKLFAFFYSYFPVFVPWSCCIIFFCLSHLLFFQTSTHATIHPAKMTTLINSIDPSLLLYFEVGLTSLPHQLTSPIGGWLTFFNVCSVFLVFSDRRGPRESLRRVNLKILPWTRLNAPLFFSLPLPRPVSAFFLLLCFLALDVQNEFEGKGFLAPPFLLSHLTLRATSGPTPNCVYSKVFFSGITYLSTPLCRLLHLSFSTLNCRGSLPEQHS